LLYPYQAPLGWISVYTYGKNRLSASDLYFGESNIDNDGEFFLDNLSIRKVDFN